MQFRRQSRSMAMGIFVALALLILQAGRSIAPATDKPDTNDKIKELLRKRLALVGDACLEDERPCGELGGIAQGSREMGRVDSPAPG